MLDLFVSTTLLLILAPIFAIIACIIKCSSPGPVLFRQKRIGKDGQQFECLKFRTMVVDADAYLKSRPELLAQFERDGFKLKNDPRITKIGSILRSTSLDELPQLLNVFKGDISLIGPRPIVPSELTMYGDTGQKLLRVKPGLSGLWQVSGRSDTSYEHRISLDMAYIDHQSIKLDLYLVWRTVVTVLLRHGAY